MERDDSLGWHVAAGLEWSATRLLLVTLKYRFAWMDPSAELPGLSSGTAVGQRAIRVFEKDFEDNDPLAVLALGLSWRL